jgi:uncharacterized protein YbjQ (UPF0145 family)
MVDIPITTADTLPRSLGGDREVKRMKLARSAHWTKMDQAADELKEWARANGYNAVIGVRYLAVPQMSSSPTSFGSAGISTDILCVLYGTAIAW